MSPSLAARMELVARDAAAEWGLRLGPRIAAGRYSYVAPAGDDAILKVVPPEDDDSDQVADALRFWDGDGAVRLLRHDPVRRALLLERIRPGTGLASVADDEEATRIAVAVGRRIWRRTPPAHPFRSVHDWVRRWMPPDSAHPLVPVARRVYASLRPRIDTLLHADFHHHNLLRRGDEWVVIDPKPLAGEPEFDLLPFLANPLGTVATPERTERRIRAFADAGLDETRIRAWALVRGVFDGLPVRPDEPESDRLRVARDLIARRTIAVD